jgi:hypothetical protein
MIYSYDYAAGPGPFPQGQVTSTKGLETIQRYFSILILTLILIGYPLVGVLTSYLGVESRTLSEPYRILVFGLSIFLIGSGVFSPLRGKIDLWLLAFLFLYLGRLCYDLKYNNIPGNRYALQFYLIAVLAPVLAVSIGRFPKTSDMQIGRVVLLLGTAIAALTLAAESLGLAYNPWADQGVLDVRLGFEALNPITLGHTGVITMICGLFMLDEKGQSKFWQLLAILALILGSAVMVKAGSRGALLSFLICSFWFSSFL